MKTRMQKYYDENGQSLNLREEKNAKLYENLSDYEVDNYELNTNEIVIDNNAQNIDVEAIKKILDTKYKNPQKRRSIVLEEQEPLEEENISLDETREYDINAILEKARSEKEENYEKERYKKVRDTQYNILNSLDIKEDNLTIEDKEQEKKDELEELINTITMRELSQKNDDIDPLDILTDLKGEDNTRVMGAKEIEEESNNETAPIMSVQEVEDLKKEEKTENLNKDEVKEEDEDDKTAELTNSLQFTQSDFDDFNDLKKEVRSSKALLYTIVILICVALLIGLVIFLNSFLNIGLF